MNNFLDLVFMMDNEVVNTIERVLVGYPNRTFLFGLMANVVFTALGLSAIS